MGVLEVLHNRDRPPVTCHGMCRISKRGVTCVAARAAGDRVCYGKTHSWGVWGSLLLIAASAVAGAAFDLQFDAAGYAWQLLNWCATLLLLLLRHQRD